MKLISIKMNFGTFFEQMLIMDSPVGKEGVGGGCKSMFILLQVTQFEPNGPRFFTTDSIKDEWIFSIHCHL